MHFRSPTGRAVLAAIVVCLRLLPGPACAAEPSTGAITAFTAKESSPIPGETLTFEVGITSNDGTSWDPSTVTATVALSSGNGAVLETSAATAPPAAVAAGVTTPVFVKLPLTTTVPGTYAAVATVTHAGAVASVSSSIPIVVGAVRAQTTSKKAAKKPLSLTVATNATLANPAAQSISVQGNGKYADGRNFSSKVVISSTNGGSQPVISFGTASTIVRAGTYAPSFDNLVLAGVTGTGFTIRRQLIGASSLQFETLSSAHATPNPFTLDGLSLGEPLGAGTLSFTAATARVARSEPLIVLPIGDALRHRLRAPGERRRLFVRTALRARRLLRRPQPRAPLRPRVRTALRLQFPQDRLDRRPHSNGTVLSRDLRPDADGR
jgi:hypothetical protein